MSELDLEITARAKARAFEKALPPGQRKRLGQFFTDIPLGRLLAHLAISVDTRTVLDPMCGHGDLLDAAWQASKERGLPLTRLDGIEIDGNTACLCRERLDAVIGKTDPVRTVLTGSAFAAHRLGNLGADAYDLVIANPPYVRYQGREGEGTGTSEVRTALIEAIKSQAAGSIASIWKSLAEGYSGLSDLSIPAWLLAGLMVRQGGRLALVAPATWRSRDYADIVRYLLLRCFAIETIVEDARPGWFSDALVRTHLIVARRLDDEEARTPLAARKHWPLARWIRVAPNAGNEHSLVGAAFAGELSDVRFASWVHGATDEPINGIECTSFDVADEWAALHARARRRRWYKALEADREELPLFSSPAATVDTFLPPSLKAMVPASVQPASLATLEQAGIHVGQGLRTGCNSFFYVDARGPERDGMVPVRGSAVLGAPEFDVPTNTLRCVVRRQDDVPGIADTARLTGRVLDLRYYVLPEDYEAVLRAHHLYEACGEQAPQVMPDDLAAFVRHAATRAVTNSGLCIPELTAVRTNIREAGCRGRPPRFWYMLPNFAPRHLPAAFIPRVNHRIPWAIPNSDSPALIDANFSTFWPCDDTGWTPHSLAALLNSAWCHTFMELLGTPLGGGALKLEATHLRQMLVPRLGPDEQRLLATAGRSLTRETPDLQARIDEIILRAVTGHANASLADIANSMASHACILCDARQKAAS